MKRKADTQAQPVVQKFSRGAVPRAPAGAQVPGGGQRRQGYGGVARAQGAAVVGEMKYFDCENANSNITACTNTWPAGTMNDPLTTINLGSAAVANPLCLFAPTVGAALNQRIGRKVKVLKIKVTGFILKPQEAAQNTADAPCMIRLMLVQDCQTNAAQMTGAQLMNDASAANPTVCSFQNPNNFGRFKVLKQKKFVVHDANMAGEVAAGNVIKEGKAFWFKMNYNFKIPCEVHFNATNGGTVADIVDNSFHIVVGANNLQCSIQYYSRVCFKE